MNEKEESYPLVVLPQNPEKRNFKKKYTQMICLLLIVFAMLAAVLYKESPPIHGLTEKSVTAVSDNGELLANEKYITISSQRNDVVDVVKFVSQSVVSINVTSPNRSAPLLGANKIGSGSGIIFGEDTEKIYIVTNNHAIQEASYLTISIDDDKEAVARIVGSNPQSDLAVVSVAKSELNNVGIENYTIATLGDSDKLEVGEYVVAIGNALGEGKTVTDGIISAKNKIINLENTKLTVLQTNAAINQGNSGGPLTNMDGEIIGINTAKLSTAGVEGMGYSIPINNAKGILDNIMQNKNQDQTASISPAKPQLGIRGTTITYDMMNQYSFPSQGVYIVEVLPGSSAENAGLRSEDIIIGFDNVRVTTIEELTSEMLNCSSGDIIKMYLYRGGSSVPQRINVTVSGGDN